MTFFGWPTWPSRRSGGGQVTTVSFQVPAGSLGFWSNRLKALGIDHRMISRFDADALVLRDADEIELELVAQASNDRWPRGRDSPSARGKPFAAFNWVPMTLAEWGATLNSLTS